MNSPIPPEAAPHLGVVLAGLLHDGNCSTFLQNEPSEVLLRMRRQIVENEPLLQLYQKRLGLPLDGPSDSISNTIPAIDAELRRRSRPKPVGGGRIAAIKVSVDLLDVAGRYTKMSRCGPGKWKGRCPIHQEKSPSFYVYEDDQHFHCFGCHQHGDVINLLALRDGTDV